MVRMKANARSRGRIPVAFSSFRRDDLVLARLTGYPQWPAMIVRAGQMPDGVREAFARSGKTHAVRFLPDADYGFFNAQTLEPLTAAKISYFLLDHKAAPARKNKPLRAAYELADDNPVSWARQMDAIVEQEKAIQELANASDGNDDNKEEDEDDIAYRDQKEEQEEKEEDESQEEEEEAPRNGNQSGSDEESEAVTSGASEEEADSAPWNQADSPAPSRKQRKRRLRADREEEEVAEALLEPTSRPSKRTRKSDATSSAAGDLTAVKPKSSSVLSLEDMPLRERPEKVKAWRFELQRIFLSSEGILLDSMDRAAEQLAMLEQATSITKEEIAFSKVNKVLKRIISLRARIPNAVEAQYRFAVRSEALLQDWNRRLGVL